MAPPFLHKAHSFFINLSFIFLLFFFLLSSSSSLKQLNDSKSKIKTRGYIDYLNLFYSLFSSSPLLGLTILFLWLLILLHLLATTASHFFCPSLDSLSRLLNLSPAIAGATLLSLGNGAPDVFSSIASFGSSAADLGLTSLLGGSFFVSAVVAGLISICSPSSAAAVAVDRSAFIRDLCFLLLSLSSLLLILSIGKVHIFGSIAFVSLYVLYVMVVSTTHCCRKELPLLDSIEVEELGTRETEEVVKLPPLLSWVLFLMELPLFLPRRLTIPVVTEEKWSKPFAVSSMILSPNLLAVLWNSQRGELYSQESIRVFLFAALIGIVLGIIVMEGTESSQPPEILLPWLAAGFLMSVVWTYIVAGELVSLLVSIGHILGISPSVLGVTVLAWGNSIGDLIANVTMAVNGGEVGAQIAIAGCYAGPIFNTLVGLGISLVLSSWDSYPSPFLIPKDSSQFMVIGFLMGGLLWALVILSRKEMKLSRSLGVGLIAIYSCFLCLRLLESLEVIQFGVS